MNSTTNIQRVNSTSYADVVGLQLGLPRFVGETTTKYLVRLANASRYRRDSSYEGLLEELSLALGLNVYQKITVTAAGALIKTGFGLITITIGSNVHKVPTCVMNADTYLVWRKLSDIVVDLNAIPGVTATLLGEDGWGQQIAVQSNVYLVVGEKVDQQSMSLAHTGILLETVLFSQTLTSSYTLNPAGQLLLSDVPPAGLTVTYQYQVNPYNIVCSDVGLFSLTDPAIATSCVNGSGVLAYQIREFINAVMSQDRCYWAE